MSNEERSTEIKSGSDKQSSYLSSKGSASLQLNFSLDQNRLDKISSVYTVLEDRTFLQDSHQEEHDSPWKAFWVQIRDRIFHSNHVILSFSNINEVVYLLIMLAEFLQLIFYVFNRVPVQNEFQKFNLRQVLSTNTSSNQTQSGGSSNNSQFSSSIDDNDDTGNIEIVENMLQSEQVIINTYFEFMNAQNYFMKYSRDFLILYLAFTLSFVLILVLMFSFGTKLFQQIKNEHMSENLKVLIRGVSLAMILFLRLFELPFTSVLLKGFTCDDAALVLSPTFITCNEFVHYLLIATSTVLIGAMYVFLFLQYQLYTSFRFTSPLPWAGFDYTVQHARSILKVVLVCGQIFGNDLEPQIYASIPLASLIICLYIISKRLSSEFLFRPLIHSAAVTLDLILISLLIQVSVELLTMTAGDELGITTVIMGSLLSIIVSALGLFWQRLQFEGKSLRLSFTAKKSLAEVEMQMVEMLRLAEVANAGEEAIRMHTIMHQHVTQCTNQACFCQKLLAKIDQVKLLDERVKTYNKRRSRISGNEVADRQSIQDFNQSIGYISPLGEFQQDSDQVPQLQSVKQRLSTKWLSRQPSNFLRKSILNMSRTSFSTWGKLMDGGESMNNQEEEEAALEELERQEFEDTFDEEGQQRVFYQFISLFIKSQVNADSSSIPLRLQLCFLQREKLKNYFKACFELLICENMNSGLNLKFKIFRSKIEIESDLRSMKDSKRQNLVDVSNTYEYEQLYSRYLMHEYQAVNASVGFWRELMQRNTDHTALNEKGLEISRQYHKLKAVTQQLQKLQPNDIKFMFRNALFMLNVLNSEYDALEQFNNIQHIFESKTSKKAGGGGGVSAIQFLNEQQIYGENSACAIVMIAANPQQIAKIIYVNEELEHLLDYKKKDVQGLNVNMLLPALVSYHHDRFIQRYLDSGKARILNKRIVNFAVNKDGYILPIEFLIKVYPQVQGKIVFVGFIQSQHQINEMPDPKVEYEAYPSHYILTDSKGYIANLSEGLLKEMGLHAKFFQLKDLDSINKGMNIQQLCSQIDYPEVSESFDTVEGSVLQFDTSAVLDMVDVELLQSDEMLQIKSNLGKYEVYTQFIKMILGGEVCEMHLYRLIVLRRNEVPIDHFAIDNLASSNAKQNILQDNGTTTEFLEGSVQTNEKLESGGHSMNTFSSTTSRASSNQSADGMLRDFKNKINEQKTPQVLIILNILIIVLILASIGLSAVDFQILKTEVDSVTATNQQYMYSEKRNLKFIELATNVRSFINVANDLEFNEFDIERLNRVEDRFTLLGTLIQEQAWVLQSIHDKITQERTKQEQDYEFEKVKVVKLNDKNQRYHIEIPFRVAFYQYINEIQNLNQTTKAKLKFSDNSMVRLSVNSTQSRNLSHIHRSAYYLIANGLYSFRVKTLKATRELQTSLKDQIQGTPFLIVMIIALTLSFFSALAVLFQLWKVDMMKHQVISVFSKLPQDDIQLMNARCSMYLEEIDSCSLLDLLETNKDRQIMQKQKTQMKTEVGPQLKNSGTLLGQHLVNADDDAISEEEKDQINYRVYFHQAQQRKRSKTGGPIGSLGSRISLDQTFQGKEMYYKMLKRMMNEIKLYQQESQASKIAPAQNQSQMKKAVSQIIKHSISSQVKGKSKGMDKALKNGLAKRFNVPNTGKNSEDSSRSHQSSSEGGEIFGDHKEVKRDRVRKKKEYNEVAEGDQVVTRQMNDKLNVSKGQDLRLLKSANTLAKLVIICITIIFGAYFVQTYLSHEIFTEDLTYIKDTIPVFFSRYRSLILSYALIRERILSNNSISSFETIPGYGQNVDSYYHDLAIENERELQQVKIKKPSIMTKMLDFLVLSDSKNFCSGVIGQTHQYSEETDLQLSLTQLRGVTTNAYQKTIDIVIKACIAAFQGDLEALKKMRQQRVNLNTGDYDNSSPIYYAVRGNQTAVVKYLVDLNVNLSPIDRWGGTPLNYAQRGSEIERILLGGGATRGKEQPRLQPAIRTNLTDDDYRLFYAASQGNVKVMQILRKLGWRVNVEDIDGRTALHLASSSNNLEAVKYLAANGADIMKQDLRGDDPIQDAIRMQREQIHYYLISIVSDSIIKQQCLSFGDGLFAKGMLSSLGTFRKKFEDIRILLANNHSEDASVLLYNSSTFRTYFQSQELYLTRVLDLLIVSLDHTYSDLLDNYLLQSEIIYGFFLVFQLSLLFLLRGRLLNRLKQQVGESRAILNILPARVFGQDRGAVEQLIRSIRD